MHFCTLVTVPLSGVRFEAAVAIYIMLGCDGREPVVPELSVGRDEDPSSRRDEAGETALGLGSSPQSLRAAIQGSSPHGIVVGPSGPGHPREPGPCLPDRRV